MQIHHALQLITFLCYHMQLMFCFLQAQSNLFEVLKNQTPIIRQSRELFGCPYFVKIRSVQHVIYNLVFLCSCFFDFLKPNFQTSNYNQ